MTYDKSICGGNHWYVEAGEGTAKCKDCGRFIFRQEYWVDAEDGMSVGNPSIHIKK